MDTQQNSTPASGQESPYFHYFLVTGEVSYLDNKFNKSPKIAKVNGVHQCPTEGLTAKELGKIQTGLQMNFYRKQSRTAPSANPPEITDVVITNVSYLGLFLPEDFLQNAPVEEGGTEESPATTDSTQAN